MLDRAACGRYLGILGLRERPPSREALAEMAQRHLQRIPFENVSKLYHRYVRRRTDLVDLESYLEDSIENPRNPTRHDVKGNQ